MTRWQKSVGATITAAAVLFGAKLWIGHLAQASEDHKSLNEAQETQDMLVALTEVLGVRVRLQDAENARDLKLCDEGIITSERICRQARLKIRP